jgi:hypothetical protein
MKIKYFSIGILLLCSLISLYPANFDIKQRADVIKLMEIARSVDQKNNFDEKIDTLAFIIREIDFKNACPCIKKVFFGALNYLSDFILDLNPSDLHKLESFLQSLLKRGLASNAYSRQIDAIKWLLTDKVQPVPKFVKHQLIKQYQKKYSSEAFVEVGSFHPNLLIPQYGKFKKMYAIGFAQGANNYSKERLKKFKNIQLLPGKDSKKLSSLVKQLRDSAVFWINAKNLSDTTNLLGIICKGQFKTVILIDHADYFQGDKIEELIKFVNKIKPSAIIDVNYNIISII